MNEKLNYLECWTSVATSLFAQALAGGPVLSESLPKQMIAGSFGFAFEVTGEESGRFVVLLDARMLEVPLLGEGADQRSGWSELLREVADAATGELLTRTGRKCQIADFFEAAPGSKLTRAFQLKAGEQTWFIQVCDEVKLAKRAEGLNAPESLNASDETIEAAASPHVPNSGAKTGLSPGLELLLDVELEASLRFGAREMPLGEILDLGPGDVVQLDRHVSDPVDLIVGDKIVARGEVVLVNGNFGLRITEVAEPQRRLESIRCLF